MDLKTTYRKIKSLEIQGATNVAMAAVNALKDSALKSKAKTPEKLFAELDKAKKLLFSARATEPMLRNFLSYFISSLKSGNVSGLKADAKKIASLSLKMKEDAKSKLIKIGAEMIKDDSIIFTHCHSSTVTGIIKQAAKTKKLRVYNTETRPRFQGRITAKELSRAGIPVTHFVDSAAKFALKKADVMLIGADAITPTSIFNKIGSELFTDLADKYDIPVYVCSVAWKFDPETIFGHEEVIEMRNPEEVWEKAPKGVKIMNYAFEKVDTELVTGIISELGIYKPDTFVELVKKAYPWMF